MYFDLFLISTILAAAYLGLMIVRRHPPGERGFGWLLLADGACAGISLVGRHGDGGPTADLLGFVALAAAFFLLIIPPMLRDVTRRAMGNNQLRWARWLLSVRELLQPGMGAREERELIDAIIAVRSGRVDDEIQALRQVRDTLEEPQQRSVDERILLTYLSARRWRDAVDIYERTFTPTTVSVQLLIEVMRAYCELGELETAAVMMRIIEGSPLAQEPMAASLIGRARMVFLAFAGRAREVEKLLGPGGPLAMMPKVGQYFWVGVARLHAGDRPEARAQLEALIAHTKRDPQTVAYAQSVLDSVDQPGVAGPRALPTSVAELADLLAERVATMKATPVHRTPEMSGVPVTRVPVTALLVAANLIVFALVLFGFGSTGDPGALVRSGANVKSAVWAGEWWRLISSMFLHVGFAHVLLNAYGLWLLGKLVEQIHGPGRMLAIYTITGIAGSASSALFGGPTMSVGASGAVLGLLGALIAELMVARTAYPERWRKSLLGNLIFVAVSMVGIGLFYEAIDQSAHVGGLFMGAMLGLILSPHWVANRSVLLALFGRALAVLSALALAYGAIGVMSTDYKDTLARYGRIEYRTSAGLAFVGPTTWQHTDENSFNDPYVFTMLDLSVGPNAGPNMVAEQLEAASAREEHNTKGVQRRPAHARLPIPDPWQSRELMLVRDDMGGDQTYRMIFFGRVAGDEVWLGRITIPDVLADSMQPTIERMLASMRRVP